MVSELFKDIKYICVIVPIVICHTLLMAAWRLNVYIRG